MTVKMGIDLGGTKTEVLVLDARQHPLYRERFATPTQDYESILSSIVGQVRRAQSSFGTDITVGIGIPGALSPRSGKLRNSNHCCPVN